MVKMILRRRAVSSIILVVIALAIPFIPFKYTSYLLSVLTFVFIYTILGESWNILGGYANQFSLGHAAFFGLGAYFMAYIWLGGVPSLLALALAGALVAMISLPLGWVCFRAKGPYFTIITLALAEVFRILFLWRPELSGFEGITLPFGFFTQAICIYYISFGLAITSIGIAYKIKQSKLGMALMAIGDDEGAANELGINTNKQKIYSFLISAFLGGISGACYGLFTLYLSPNDVFHIIYSLNAILIVMIGGAGMPLGPIWGASILLLLEETLMPITPGAHLLILAAILIGMMFMMPQGLWGYLKKSLL